MLKSYAKYNRILRDRRGSVGLFYGLISAPILLVLGAAVDYSRAAMVRTRLQAAVDSAALAVASQGSLTQAQRAQIANNVVLSNLGSWAGAINPTVTETEPSGFYQVTAIAATPTVFMKIAAIESMSLGATARAATSTAGSSAKVCILALSKTASPGLLVNSGVNINAPNCQIDVKSTGSPAATFNASSTLNVSKICVAGANTLNNATPAALKTNCTTASDPFAGNLPTVSAGGCTVSNQNYSGDTTLDPGVYCGGFNFNSPGGTLTFKPGLYVFRGVSWNINNGWTMVGNGVTFYFEDASYMQINSGVGIYLSAPSSGTYADIMMFEKPGLSESSFSINGSAGHTFSGLIYLPSRNVTFNSVSNVASENVTIVVNSIILDGSNWNLNSSAKAIAAAGAAAGPPRLVQ